MERGAREVLARLDDGKVPVTHPMSFFHGLPDAISAPKGGTLRIPLELMFRKTGIVISRIDSNSGGGGGVSSSIDGECLLKALQHFKNTQKGV